MSSSTSEHPGSTTSAHCATRMTTLAMSSFVEPMLRRTRKLKPPLKSVYDMVYGCDDGLLLSDNKAGKIMTLHPGGVTSNASKGVARGATMLIDNVSPYGISMCGVPDSLAVVHSTIWDESVKIVSTKHAGRVLATWGGKFQQWTPRALAVTIEGHIVVSNIHQRAACRLSIYNIDGQQISAFGRANGPGNQTFCQPLHIAIDNTTGRIVASDTQTNSVKVFDQRGHFISEFGSKSSDLSSTLDRPLGLCCDRRGNVIVCDSGNDRLAMFSNDGRFICNLLNFNASAGKGSSLNRTYPVAVTLSDAGDSLTLALDVTSRAKAEFRKLAFYDIQPSL